MTSKQNIFDRIRKNRLPSYDMPSLDTLAPVQYEDVLEKFIESTYLVGGQAVLLEPGQDINDVIRSLYPEASVIASALPYIDASLNPDTVTDASDLDGVEVGIVEGKVAVAENGCVWIPQTMKERAVLFISECLVILIDRKDIVCNMHQAYEKIENSGYGCFISGPSKTADIAQALVMGAQAAREVTVIVCSTEDNYSICL